MRERPIMGWKADGVHLTWVRDVAIARMPDSGPMQHRITNRTTTGSSAPDHQKRQEDD